MNLKPEYTECDMYQNYKNINVEVDGHVATLWLNRPEKHNALSLDLLNEVTNFFHRVDVDDNIRIIIIRGQGKSFCAGADISWMKQSAALSEEANLSESKVLSRFFETIFNSLKVTIAVVHGNAFGGGCGLVSVCDLAYTSQGARFSLSETRLGLIAATITPYMLMKLPMPVYKEMVFTAKKFDGEEAEKSGLVNRNFESSAELEQHLNTTIKEILKGGPESLSGSKKMINGVMQTASVKEKLKEVPEILAKVRVSAEAKEGFKAFLEKRKPNW
jgi:methylglutaconyl-CoA hydratase